MLTTAAPELLHIVGYLTGAALYAMLLAMVVRASRADRLMVVTAAFGIAWNLGELLVQAGRRAGTLAAVGWLEAASYSALGALAAVVVHSVTRDPGGTETRRASIRRAIAVTAYALAAAAAVLHLQAAATGGIVPSRAALVLLTAGLVILAPALVLTTQRQASDRRALWMMALTVFAISALHLGGPHRPGESWALELVGHHASIPLAFAILYEDYRFALADLFLKQALTLVALVTLVFAASSMLLPDGAAAAAGQSGLLLALWIGTALLFPWMRRGVSAFVDRFVLGRADYAAFVDRFATSLQSCDAEEPLLDRACSLLAPALNAATVTWSRTPVTDPATRTHGVTIATSEAPHYALAVGPLAGGRRLLSDDEAMLERAAILIARRIDALRLTNERYERVLLEREMQALATEAELRALRAQVNPHFLFNALTTIGYLIQHAPPRALDTLLRLTTLLRGVLRSEGEFTTLGHERELIECYLDIECERFEERLQVAIDIPPDLRTAPIPSLIVQPLVENAIKHGIAPAREGGRVAVTARLLPPGSLHVTVRNTGAPLGAHPDAGAGVGLPNVARRLACCYGDAARVDLRSDPDGSTVAELRVPMTTRLGQDSDATPAPLGASSVA
jgi:two-component system LytT family sensor kinase